MATTSSSTRDPNSRACVPRRTTASLFHAAPSRLSREPRLSQRLSRRELRPSSPPGPTTCRRCGDQRLPDAVRPLRRADRRAAVRDLRMGPHHPHRAQPGGCAVRQRPDRPGSAGLRRRRRRDRGAARHARTQGTARQHDDRRLRGSRRRLLDPWIQGRHGPCDRAVHADHMDAAGDPGSGPRLPESTTGLASTIDIAPTCLALLGHSDEASFPYSGSRSSAPAVTRALFAELHCEPARQPAAFGIAKAFAVDRRRLVPAGELRAASSSTRTASTPATTATCCISSTSHPMAVSLCRPRRVPPAISGRAERQPEGGGRPDRALHRAAHRACRAHRGEARLHRRARRRPGARARSALPRHHRRRRARRVLPPRHAAAARAPRPPFEFGTAR